MSAVSGISWMPGAEDHPAAAGPHPLNGPDVAADTDDDQDRAISIYQYVARAGEVSSLDALAGDLGMSVGEAFSAVTRLVELGLIRTAGGNRLLAVDPGIATQQVVSPLERWIYQRSELADQLRDRIRAVAPSRFGSIDPLEGVMEIRGLLRAASAVCRDELLILRPGDEDEQYLDELLEACRSVLDRQVRVRMICPHRSRAGFDSRAKTRRFVVDGADVRTLARVPQAGVVFDGQLAVTFGLSPDGTFPVARRVRDPEVVRFLIDLFDQLWECAIGYAAQDAGYSDAMDNLQQSIARLMAQGLTDEVVARRLGMSVRTCRRHIAALLQNLNSVSRFQAGVQAAQQLGMPSPSA